MRPTHDTGANFGLHPDNDLLLESRGIFDTASNPKLSPTHRRNMATIWLAIRNVGRRISLEIRDPATLAFCGLARWLRQPKSLRLERALDSWGCLVHCEEAGLR